MENAAWAIYPKLYRPPKTPSPLAAAIGAVVEIPRLGCGSYRAVRRWPQRVTIFRVFRFV